jgi:hypothetical protein
MIRTTRNAAGNLVITADNEGRRDLAEAYAAGGYDRAEMEVAESIVPNSELMFIPPEQVGALTGSPILGEAAWTDDGGMDVYGAVFWFPDYMVRDPWEELKNKGRVVFINAA